MTRLKSVAILGGGITGLTAAYRLSRAGHKVRVFEKSNRVGGAIRTEMSDGWLVEQGPNSIQESTPELSALIDELGLARLEALPAAKNRYLVRDSSMIPVPLSPPALLGSPLFSLAGKLRIVSELLCGRKNRTEDVSLAGFAREHFGQEFLDRAVRPFVSGIYAGDADKLSARHAFPRLWDLERTRGSILKGQMASARARRARGEKAMPGLISFPRGLQAFPDALASRLPEGSVALGAAVTSATRTDRWRVAWNDGNGAHEESFDSVIAALPARALAGLSIGSPGAHPLASLAGIEYPPLASLFLGYRANDVSHPLDGFGALIPPAENRSILGVLFSSSLFAGRAPAGHVALTVMIGGALRPDLASLPVDRLLDLVRSELRTLLGVRGDPVFVRHACWPEAIPQYNLGYERHLETLAACERAHPGFHIGGNVRDGISLPNCIAAGMRLAQAAESET